MKIKDRIKELRRVPAGKLLPNPKNWRTHPPEQADAMRGILAEVGFADAALAVETPDGLQLIDGHLRTEVAPDAEVPVLILDVTEEEADRILATHDPIAAMAGSDANALAELLDGMKFDNDATQSMLDDLAGGVIDDAPVETDHGSLEDDFLVPPFSVLDTRQGYWQDRKREWRELGVASELGRDSLDATAAQGASDYEYMAGRGSTTGGSIFDPVLTELVYTWFTPPAADVLDPFAGGSVRGLVASCLYRRYVGIDLRTEQVEANEQQWEKVPFGEDRPTWIKGDSINVAELTKAKPVDFIFSCPPYGDLEKYSDDPGDLSNMTYTDFMTAYRAIIAASCDLLREDRFACFVVGEFRDTKGNYRNFVSDTIDAFRSAGLHYYNEVILVNAIGSLPVRIGKQFRAGRKIGKTHQNVLVFVKGDSKKATAFCGPVKVSELEQEEVTNATR